MIFNFYYYFVRFSYTLGSSRKDTCFFLHCIDSRIERGNKWYSRFHIGPFIRGSGLLVGTALRRSLLNDLRQTSIVAIELEGVLHEFSRLHGVYENLLDLLFQFRKISLYSSFLRLGETIVIPFLFFGPGTFYAKDVLWPKGIQCRNPNILLTTISSSRIIRGHMLIQKNTLSDLIPKRGKQFHFHKIWRFKNRSSNIKFKKKRVYHWLSTGFPHMPIERVGFRIESIKSLHRNQERLVLEIVTNGTVSPRFALKESTLSLINKFSIISERISPIIVRNKISRSKIPNFSKIFLEYFKQCLPFKNFSGQNSHTYIYPEVRFLNFREPLRLNLADLEITRERYVELQNMGFSNIGQLLERLIYDVDIFSPLLKKQRQQALLRIGVFIY